MEKQMITPKRITVLALAFYLTAPFAMAASEQIFDDNANVRQLIASAIAEASRDHKNIVLDFGANWCPDCHALHEQMHQGELASIIQKNFVVVPVSVGRYDRNLDIARQYDVPLRHGIPALAILDSHGKLLYSMKDGQFSNARSMNSVSFIEFFRKWEPKR
jgi:thioredoxin 1